MDLLRMYTRWIFEFNPVCRGAIESLTNYVVKKGFSYNVIPKRNKNVNKAEIDKAQDIIDKFLEANQWELLEPEFYKRAIRDGEVPLCFYPQEDQITRVRVIEPEQIKA